MWKKLGFEGQCPFPTPDSSDGLAAHQKEYKLLEEAQQPKHSLSKLLNTASDGWAPLENWEAIESARRELFEGLLREVVGNEQPDNDEPIRYERDLREIWPFDLKE